MEITKLEEWKALELHKHLLEKEKFNLQSAFDKDKERFNKFSIEFEDIFFDYSKNLIDSQALKLLIDLAKARDLNNKIEKCFVGDKINITEDRAVLHTALRQSSGNPVYVSGENVIQKVHKELDKMENFVNSIYSSEFTGSTGKKITDVVNIGIGGSDLGPNMVTEALNFYSTKHLKMHFVSNVDGTDIATTLNKLDPESTLFIISSKTFTTQETMLNATTAKKWLLEKLPYNEKNISPISNHFIAVSTNIQACVEFGIAEDKIFKFWNWVGGRFSLWSSIGISIALSIGMNNFLNFLAGAEAMDNHFRYTSFEKNIPVIMGLLGVWYVNFFGAETQCIIPYDHYLSKLPLYLQQLDMESNGKCVNIEGKNISYYTAPILWGAAGTNAQHSFFQLIHQSNHLIPVDFIAFANSLHQIGHHNVLLSNFFAQTEALMKGKNSNEVEKELIKSEDISKKDIDKLIPHKVFKGNKPTNSILIKKLTPYSLGSLISMYEHKIFVQGIIWNINSFDQWGVELGKQLAKRILPELCQKNYITNHDSSTNGLINKYKDMQI